MPSSDDQVARIETLEREVARLAAEVAQLRGERRAERAPPPPDAARIQSAAERLYHRATGAGSAAVTGDQIESFVGRYGTLLGAALVILMAVGVLVEVAVSRGLLTATVRVALGALVAIVVGGAGLHFRHRGEVRYGDVLLSIALAIVDLVAWGAGPRLHIVSPALALIVVDVVAAGIAMLALHDDNEFLFAVAVGGALSAPFVTSTGEGTALMLLSYGAAVLVSSTRIVRNPAWRRALALLVAGAAVYILAVAALPLLPLWYDPYLIVLFGGTCALGALLAAPPEWRGDLSRALLLVSLVGVTVSWDHAVAAPFGAVAAIALSLAAVTYASLAVRRPEQQPWVATALVLPLLSLGVAYPAGEPRFGAWPVLALWAAFALGAWQVEQRRGERERGGAHLLSAGLLGCLAIVAGLWDYPLPLVAALGLWGVVLSAAGARELSPLPLAGVAAALGGAGALAIDQLASRLAYAYTPFLTRSSASALSATVALAVSAELIGRGDEPESAAVGLKRWADRPLRLGLVIGYAILWGRMELAQAFSRDLATFLLILYYAACGLATILAGRHLGVQRLRMAGLAMSLYAAVKAVLEVAGMEGILLRVGSYGAVGLFLLGAGYLYRVRRSDAAVSPGHLQTES
jgi:uncharacterized membrane protein